MQTIFDAQTYEQIVRRVESLKPDSARQWGKMTASQMLEHSSRALEMATGARPTPQMFIGKLIGWIVFRGFIGERPFARNAPTGPDFIVKDEPDFSAAKAKTLALLKDLHEQGEQRCEGRIHGFFGPMTGAHWGISQFKHMDHHLRQFGA